MVRQLLNTLNTELPSGPAAPAPIIYTKEMDAGTRRNIYTPLFIAGLFTIAKKVEAAQVPLEE